MSPMITPYARCHGCGKRGYWTKQDAKRIRRELHDSQMSVYRCVANPDLWHVGHLPKMVLDGRVSRTDLGLSAKRSL